MADRRFLLLILAAVCILGCVACNGGGDDEPPRTTLTIFAASSLTEAFEDAATEFMARRTDIDVRFNFAGSPTLRTQLDQDAAADVYAAADVENMQAALAAGLVLPDARTFARNALTVIVPADNPGNVHLLSDLGKQSLRIVMAAPEVPAGRYTLKVLDKIAEDDGFVPGLREMVLANVVSQEPNVKSVVAKVQLGEADAGIVYVSDVTPEIDDDVDSVEIPLDYNIEAAYPVAITSNAAEPEAAQAFIDFLLSDEGQDIFEVRGFERAS
ncbi:MAG: molybdate ABC transporter substrate-binding protein [Dehalococcoidia bacterium]